MATPEQIKAALDKIASDVSDRTSELQARMHAVEQHVVKLEHGGGGMFGAPFASLAALATDELTQSQAFGHVAAGNQGTARVHIAASLRAALTHAPTEGTLSEGAYMPSNPERGGIGAPVAGPQRLLQVLPSRPVTRDAVEYVQLHVSGEVAEQENEGDEKAELGFAGELIRSEIATIAGWTAASKQVLSDHAGLQTAIDQTIRTRLLARLEHLLINGGGSDATGKIVGLLAQATEMIPTIGTTPADIAGEALVRQSEAGYSPTAVVLNPLDWFRIQLTRKADDDQEYIFGSPTMPVPPALWNTAVVACPSMPEGRGMTLDAGFVTVLDRESPSIMVSNSHSDFFTRNLVAVLGELRAGLEVRDRWALYAFDLNHS